MKKYYAPICDLTAVNSRDVITTSGDEGSLKFGRIFEMIAIDDGGGVNS